MVVETLKRSRHLGLHWVEYILLLFALVTWHLFIHARRTTVTECCKEFLPLHFLSRRYFSIFSELRALQYQRSKITRCPFFWLRGLLTQESRPNYQLCTLYLAGQDCPVSFTWTDYLTEERMIQQAVGTKRGLGPKGTLCVSLASWGALITPMS